MSPGSAERRLASLATVLTSINIARTEKKEINKNRQIQMTAGRQKKSHNCKGYRCQTKTKYEK
jgi:hypothetical protein